MTVVDGRSVFDLNDANEPKIEYDVDELSAKLADRAAEWVPQYFPRGRVNNRGDELRLANIKGDAPRREGSCVITLKGDEAGWWYDHSTGDGGKALSTLGEAAGLSGIELLERAAEIVGATPSRKANGHSRSRPADDARKASEIAFIRQQCVPPRSTPVEIYLQARGLDLPDCPDLLYHDNLTDWAEKIGRPAMVAIIRDPETGQPTGGIHRTYLADDGAAKANIPKPKMMLGPSSGVVQLMPIRAQDGALAVGEGQETSLAGARIFDLPAWAALSAGNMRKMKFPPDLRRLLILADRGDDGQSAATELCHRALEQGIDAWIVLPQGDDDFADDLARGECRADSYQWLRPPGAASPLLIEPGLPQPAIAYQPPGQRQTIELIHFRDIQPSIEDRSIVHGLLNQGEIGLGVGASGTAKTFLMIDMGLHVAAGREWFGHATRPMGVIYIAAEAGRGIINRVAAYKLYYPDIPVDLPFAAIVSPVNLREKFGSNTLMEVLDAIQHAELTVPVGLIIVDTLSRAMAGGDENSSEDMGEFVGNMDQLRAATGAHILIVHHLGKDATRGARGHSLLHAAVDTEITITRDNVSGISTAAVTKQRELPTAGQMRYRLHSVELGRDQSDRPVTSCVIEAADETDAGTGKSKASCRPRRSGRWTC